MAKQAAAPAAPAGTGSGGGGGGGGKKSGIKKPKAITARARGKPKWN